MGCSTTAIPAARRQFDWFVIEWIGRNLQSFLHWHRSQLLEWDSIDGYHTLLVFCVASGHFNLLSPGFSAFFLGRIELHFSSKLFLLSPLYLFGLRISSLITASFDIGPQLFIFLFITASFLTLDSLVVLNLAIRWLWAFEQAKALCFLFFLISLLIPSTLMRSFLT